MQTILGGGGAIGIPLAKELRNHTNTIRIVSRHPNKVNVTDNLFPADLTRKTELFSAVAGSDVVYLTLGLEKYSTEEWAEKWPALIENVIGACKKHSSRLVFFDNIYMYDCDAIGNMTEETPINPCSQKGEIRAEVAKMVIDEFQKDELNAIIARSADFYGPGAHNSILEQTVIKNLKKGKKAMWMADAGTVHNFTFTPDAAKATALLGNSPNAYNQVWHLPTDHSKLTGRDWIELIAKEMDAKPAYRTLSIRMMGLLGYFMPIMKELKEMAYQYDRDYFFNSTKFEETFGVTPTTPEDGVRQMLR